MAKGYISNRQKNLSLGIVSYTENQEVLSAIGKVGIGTRIDITPYDTLSDGTLSFEGSAGQLFSITNNLTSGSIFSVNDVSGIPSIDVDADGTVQLAPFGASEYVGIGTTNPTTKLDVNGTAKATLFVGSGASLTNIPNGALDNSTVSYGGVQLSLGGSDATPAFDLSDATNYPYTSLTGITTNIVGDTTPQLGGDLDVNGNDITGTGNINLTGVITATSFVGDGTGITGLTAGQVGALADIVTDTTPQLGGDLDVNGNDITGTGNINLTGVITATSFSGDGSNLTGLTAGQVGALADIVTDTTPQLGGDLDVNGNDITGTGNINLTGVITATSFDGSLATTNLTGTITNAQLAGSIDNSKLSNSTVSYGGVLLSLGGSDATPAFDLSDATNYPYSSLTGITTDILGDTTPQLGGNLDLNGNNITGTGNISITGNLNVTGVSTFQGNVNLGDNDVLNIGDGNDLQIYHDGSNSFMLNSTGELQISSGGSTLFIQAVTNENAIKVVPNAAVELYYDNSKKFETTTTGITVFNGASTSATIAGPDEIIIDPATVGDDTGSVRIKGDLYVDGTTTQINSTTIELADFIVGIATTATTDTLADGAGIQIGPDNTFLYEYNGGTNPSLKSSENLNVESGKGYQVNQVEVLNATTLGSSVVNSSLTNLGTLTALTVSGTIDANGNLDVDGHTELDNLNVSGVSTFTGNVTIEDSELKVGDVSGDSYVLIKQVLSDDYGFDWQHNNASVFINEQGDTNQALVLGDVDANNSYSGLFGISHTSDGGSNWAKKLDLRGNGDLYIGSSAQNRVLTTADEGTGNGLDADTLDGIEASSFLRSDTSDTVTGGSILNFQSSAGTTRGHLQATDTDDAHFIIATSGSEDIAFKDGGVSGTTNMIIRGDGTLLQGTSNTIWHEGNHGSGSGLDADLLDGQHGSYYLNTGTNFGGDVSGTYNAIVVANDSHKHAFDNLTGKTSGTGEYSTSGILESGRGSGGVALTINDGYGNANVTFNHKSGTPEQNGKAGRIEVNTDSTIGDATMSFELGSATSGVAAGITQILQLSSGTSTWSSSAGLTFDNIPAFNGGTSGSTAPFTVDSTTKVTNLNADLLDDISSGSFLRSDADDTATGQILINNNQANPLELQRSSQVGIEFNDTSVGSRYLGVNGGVLRYGSNLNHGINSKIWHEGNHGSGSGLDADLLDGQHGSYYLNTSATTQTKSGGLNVSGNVGIGTDNPTERLQVQGNAVITSSLYVGSATNSSLQIINAGQDIFRPNGRILLRGGGGQSTRNSIELTNSIGIVIDGGSGETYGVELKGGGGPVKVTQGNFLVGTSAATGTASQLLQVNSGAYISSLVGIGITNPTSKLHVVGDAKVTGVSTFQGNVNLGDNHILNIGDGNDLQIYHNGSNSYIDDGSGTGALIFKSNLYSFRNAADSEQIATFNENAAVELYYDNSKKLETTTTGITVTGDVNSTSDINLKKDIEVVSKPIDLLNEIKGVKFTWKETETQSVGVIAQEVEAILPELVRGEEGNKSVNYSGLIGVLIEAVKEQQNQINELKQEILELKEKF